MYFYLLSTFVIICIAIFARNYNNEPLTPDGGEGLFMLLLTATSNSLCPEEKRGNFSGRLYYPLGIFWLSINLSRRFNALFSSKKSIKLKNLISTQLYDTLNSASYVLKFLNLFLLPLFLFLGLIAISFLTGFLPSHVFFWFFGLIPAILIADCFMPGSLYAFNTRTFGYYITTSLVLFLTCLTRIDQISTLNISEYHFKYNSFPIESFFVLNPIFLYIFTFIFISSSFLLVTRVSQQGSQLFISLLIASCFLKVVSTSMLPVVFLAIISAIIFQMQYVYLDAIPYYLTHFYNRYHELFWSLRTYGSRRYKFLNLSSTQFKRLFHEIITFNIFTPSYGFIAKRAWISFLFTQRAYLYFPILLLVANYSNLPEISASYPDYFYCTVLLKMGKIILFSALVPALLCLLRPFQGYGPPHQYFDNMLPFLLLCDVGLLQIFLFNGNLGIPSLLVYLLSFIAFDLFIYGIFTFYYTLNKVLKSLLFFKDTARPYLFLPYESHIDSQLVALINFIAKLNPRLQFRVGVIETHLQLTIQSLVSAKVSQSDKSDCGLVMAVPMIDSNCYGFYDDYTAFSNSLQCIAKFNINMLILNLSLPAERRLLKVLSQGSNKLYKISDKYHALIFSA